MTKKDYLYEARVMRVVDGDTIDVDVDLGFSVVLRKQRLRLARINAPEMHGESSDAGKKSKEALRALVEDKEVLLKTHKSDKYGRIVTEIFLDGVNINDRLLAEDHAVPFVSSTS